MTMPDQSPAEELRAAAEAMRERAHAAARGHSGWHPGHAGMPSRPAVLDESGWPVAYSDVAEAVHIASWSPPVALAVADWLDGFHDLSDPRPLSQDASHALAVARAYLGTAEPSPKGSAAVKDSNWRKAQASVNHGQCVEVASLLGGMIGLRDSKDPDGPFLRYTPAEWGAFLDGVKKGEFDDLAQG